MTLQLSNVELEHEGPIAIAVVSGEVDMSNAASVREQISGSVSTNDEALVVDLTSLAFIDSAGLHVLFDLAAALSERRQHLRLIVPPGSQVARAVEIVGLPRAISVDPDRETALSSVLALGSESRPVPPGGENP